MSLLEKRAVKEHLHRGSRRLLSGFCHIMAAASIPVPNALEKLWVLLHPFCNCLTLPSAFQEGECALDTWRSTVESVHSDVGYAPAMAMLSAYGFYNGQSRSDPGGGPAARTGAFSMPCCVLTCDIFDEVSCCIIPAMPLVGSACICILTFVLQEAGN